MLLFVKITKRKLFCFRQSFNVPHTFTSVLQYLYLRHIYICENVQAYSVKFCPTVAFCIARLSGQSLRKEKIRLKTNKQNHSLERG